MTEPTTDEGRSRRDAALLDTFPEPSPPASWLVVYTKPNCEKKATRWLCMRGWVVYFPVLSEQVITRGGERTDTRPLFPRYVFVQDQQDMDPVDVAYLPGVSDVVRRGDKSFARLENEVIEALRSTEQQGVLQPEPPDLSLLEGDAVHVELSYGGIGYHLVAQFKQMDGVKRAVVLHEMFGSKRESTVTLDKLTKVMADVGSS